MRLNSIQGQHLLNSSVTSKIFRNCKGFEKSQFIRSTKNYDVVGLKQTFQLLTSRCFATNQYLHGTSNLFPCFLLPMTSHVDCPMCLKKMPNFSGQLSRNVTNNLISSLHTCGKAVMFVPSSSAKQCTLPKTGFHTALWTW